LPPVARRNIEIIAEVEQQLLEKRSAVQRIGEWIAWFFGSLVFVIAQAVFYGCWILFNTGFVPGAKKFDPYPFPLLSLVVGTEFILLTTFVLINQKHQIRREEQWSHLHLQVSMLTEQEVTKNMQMLARLCQQAGLTLPAGDKEMDEMAQPTSVRAVLGELEKSREAGAPNPTEEAREKEAEESSGNPPAN
jgi:uncharacterized membrane protein